MKTQPLSAGEAFERREERRWHAWFHRKAKPQVQARRRRASAAAGSISATLRPVAFAKPNPSDGFLSRLQDQAASRAQARFDREEAFLAPLHVVRNSRDVELEQLIREQALEMYQESGGRVFTDREPHQVGLSLQGDLLDEQAWHSHVLGVDPRSYAPYTDRGRLGFVAWDSRSL